VSKEYERGKKKEGGGKEEEVGRKRSRERRERELPSSDAKDDGRALSPCAVPAHRLTADADPDVVVAYDAPAPHDA
jgi:hypothetical protein